MSQRAALFLCLALLTGCANVPTKALDLDKKPITGGAGIIGNDGAGLVPGVVTVQGGTLISPNGGDLVSNKATDEAPGMSTAPAFADRAASAEASPAP